MTDRQLELALEKFYQDQRLVELEIELYEPHPDFAEFVSEELNGSPKKKEVSMVATGGSDAATPEQQLRFADFLPTTDLDEGSRLRR